MASNHKRPIRVLIVDDSPVVRAILLGMLESMPEFSVVGQAKDGQEGVDLTASLHPDVIAMDTRMPRLDGLEATKRIMSTTPTPIVVMASSCYESELKIAFNAIAGGAISVVEKPKCLDAAGYNAVRNQLVSAVDRAADHRHPRPGTIRAVAMAATTGEPGVLARVVEALPATLSAPVLVVQQLAPGFGRSFAQWLQSHTELAVAIAEDGMPLTPGYLLLAPVDAHLLVAPGDVVRLDRTTPLQMGRPSPARLFQSLAEVYGGAALGIQLTEMEEEDLHGLEALADAGGFVIVQSDDGCVSAGAARAAIARGIAGQVLPPAGIAAILAQLCPSPAARKGGQARW